MRLTGFDVLAFVAGIVAVVFSGFVLVYSTGGGIALFVGGGVALSIALVRERFDSRGAVVATWIVVIALFGAGIAGFLSGYGTFDEPELTWESETATYDAGDGRTVVVVTGAVANDGAVSAERLLVTATLRDVDGAAVAADSRQLTNLAAGSEQLFYVQFEGASADFEGVVDAEVTVEIDS